MFLLLLGVIIGVSRKTIAANSVFSMRVLRLPLLIYINNPSYGGGGIKIEYDGTNIVTGSSYNTINAVSYTFRDEGGNSKFIDINNTTNNEMILYVFGLGTVL